MKKGTRFVKAGHNRQNFHNCHFCGSGDIEFFTGKRASREAAPIKYTGGFVCRTCGAVTFWTFTPEEFYELGRDGVRSVCRRMWSGVRSHAE